MAHDDHTHDPDNRHLTSALFPGRGYHDVGGLQAGPVSPDTSDALPWERLSVVIGNVLGLKGAKLVRVDEVRRTREEMGVELYNELGYFERGTEALSRLLIEKGIVTRDELEQRMQAIGKRIAENGR